MSTTYLKDLKNRFEKSPTAFGVNANWKEEIKSQTKITAAIHAANNSMKSQLEKDQALLEKIETRCDQNKVAGMFKCKGSSYKCSKRRECRTDFEQLYHIWSNEKTAAIAYYTSNSFKAKSHWRRQWNELNEKLDNILRLTFS